MPLAFSFNQFFSDHLTLILPSFSVGVICVYVIALLMWLKFFGVRCHWWWIALGALSLGMLQSFSFLLAFESYRLLIMPNYVWTPFAVEVSVLIARWAMVIGFLIGFVWVFLPGVKSDPRKRINTPKIFHFIFYMICLFLIGSNVIHRDHFGKDWAQGLPLIKQVLDLPDSRQMALGYYREEHAQNSYTYEPILLEPGRLGLMHRVIILPEEDSFKNTLSNPSPGEWKVAFFKPGLSMSDDNKLVYWSLGYMMIVLNHDGENVHEAWHPLIDKVHYQDVTTVRALTPDANAEHLVITAYKDQHGNPLLPSLRDPDQKLLYLLLLYQRHGISNTDRSMENILWGWEPPVVELIEIPQ